MPISKVYLVDLIGSHAGMDYYDKSFVREIQDEQTKVDVLSTFALSNKKPFLRTMFKKNKLVAIILMLQNYLKLMLFMLRHKENVYIFMSYGEVTDFLFFTLGLIPRVFFVDIHELYAARYAKESPVAKLFNWYYRKIIKYIIYHSDKTLEGLQYIGYKGVKLFVPHFKYNINTDYNVLNIGSDVSRAFSTNKKKMLFFGNIRKVKGIDIIVDYIESHKNIDYEVEFVIAGKNVENICLERIKDSCHIIDRHINDDELKFLYSKTDYVLLPYRDSSQSGILEMAFCFRKPMLLSNIPYFSKIVSKYPSFGEIEGIKTYDRLLDEIIMRKLKKDYYTKNDCDNFQLRKEIEEFKNEFESTII